jgi:hypothetical protein
MDVSPPPNIVEYLIVVFAGHQFRGHPSWLPSQASDLEAGNAAAQHSARP